MHSIRYVIGLLLCLWIVPVLGMTRPKTEAERLERAVKLSPGDMESWCALVGLHLSSGDTVKAEESLRYSLKISDTPCLYMHQARLCAGHQDLSCAARYCAQAIKAGLRPTEDSSVYHIDSLSEGGVKLCLRRMVEEDRKNISLWYGLGELSCLQGDTASAMPYYEAAYHLGDSTAGIIVDSLKSKAEKHIGKETTDSDKIEMIPYSLQSEKIELRCKLNGLPIRVVLDTTATSSTISGVETMFMLKNDYISKDDIRNNTAVIIRRLELTGNLHLDNVLLDYAATQDDPVVITLRELERIGKVHINERKRVIEIIR